jgi:hypothetical protein
VWADSPSLYYRQGRPAVKSGLSTFSSLGNGDY